MSFRNDDEAGRIELPEAEAVRRRYARRHSAVVYSMLNAYSLMAMQEKERALVRLIEVSGLPPVEKLRVLEIGCGNGGNLVELMRLGFLAENLVGNELIESRCEASRHNLPASTRILCGDAAELELPPHTFDIVLQSTVFTSILSDSFQEKLARRMWELAKPNGGILWYDFVYNNPRNPDVRGVPLKRVRELFPKAEILTWRLTLAPPIGRTVTQLHSSLYILLNALPILRTHVLCWIRRPRGS